MRKWLDKTAFKPAMVVTDNYFHLGFASLWALYALWGFTSILAGLPSLEQIAGPDVVGFAWKSLIILTCSIAFWGAMCLHHRMERYALMLFAATMAGYFLVLLIFSAIGGDTNFAPQAILALSFLVAPLLRLRFLTKRVKGTGM